MRRRFFQIGFDGCGTSGIEALFRRNAIPIARGLDGALAEDIAYARLTGGTPLARWPDIVAFADMRSVRFLNMPMIEAFREFAFLDHHHPGAVFLLNTGRVEDWVARRYLHRDGAPARSIAAGLGVALGDLADLWAADWDDHIAAARAHFGDRAEFVQLDMDSARPGDLRDALAPWFDLPHLPDANRTRHPTRQADLKRVALMLDEPLPGADIDPDRRARLVRRLVRLATPARMRQKGSVDRPPHADALCLDMDAGTLRTADGTRMPLRRGPTGQFYLEPGRPGLLRAAAMANDIAALTGQGRYWLDARPASFAGSGPDDPADGPLIVTLRRAGARNAFLWPAPWLHRIGNPGFPGHPDAAGPGWDDRGDGATWRGTLSGHVPGTRQTAEALVTALLSPPDGASHDHARAALRTLPRWRFLAQYVGRPGLDLALDPDPRLAQAGLDLPAPFAGPPAPARHAICLPGSEGDAGFLALAATNAVVLKEDDGWENAITGLFQPDRHYLALAQGGGDLDDRLDWARANPKACRQMSQRAQRLCSDLADPAGRRLHLTQVLAAYRQATGQD